MTNWTSATCTANGINIHYLRTGGHKPVLVALHGLIKSGACWSCVTRALEGDYDVVMPDARGHGKSSAPPRGYSYPEHACDVIGLVDALELSQPFILGHSMGGMTAAVAASQLGCTIGAVILVDPTFINLEWQREVHEGKALEQHRQLLTSTRDAFLADLRRRHPHRSSELQEHTADARLATHVGAFEVLTPPNPDYRELVSSIRVPMLLVIADGGIVSVDTARELQKLNPLLQYEQLAEAGHGLPFDQPERLAMVVQSFLRHHHAKTPLDTSH